MMSKRLRKHMNDADNFSISEITTLSHLYNDESHSPSELADLIKVKTQSMSEVLSRLCKLGIINKTVSATDKRKFVVTLTENGRKIVEQTRYERDEWLTNAIESQLNDREKEVLSEAVILMERLGAFQ